MKEKRFVTEVGLKRFAQWKKTALSKCDMSRKGTIDEPLVKWVQLINDSPAAYTTSCCSGRYFNIFQQKNSFQKKNFQKKFLKFLLIFQTGYQWWNSLGHPKFKKKDSRGFS